MCLAVCKYAFRFRSKCVCNEHVYKETVRIAYIFTFLSNGHINYCAVQLFKYIQCMDNQKALH
jgi:hypothetical protein